MTQEMIQKLSDVELLQAIAWATDEQKARLQKRKQETIAKIRVLAAQAGIAIAIEGVKGRPRSIENAKQEEKRSRRAKKDY